MKSTNPSINTVLILGAGELGLPVLRAMSRQARLHHALKSACSSGRRPLAPSPARIGRGGMRWRGSVSL